MALCSYGLRQLWPPGVGQAVLLLERILDLPIGRVHAVAAVAGIAHVQVHVDLTITNRLQ